MFYLKVDYGRVIFVIIFKDSAVSRGRSVYPKVTVFKEILPLASKNVSNSKIGRPAASSCTQELQALFGCLKKWEFDDKPCEKQHAAYMDCVHEAERVAKEYKEAAAKGTLGEGGQGKSLTAAQFNKLMTMFPQPDLGQRPYRQMKRLPTQSYAEDIFHRKHWKGKAS
nr:Coiled-coil-helix-coiled-coil-helix-containing protein 1 domain containing protein [Haemonchus contortus]